MDAPEEGFHVVGLLRPVVRQEGVLPDVHHEDRDGAHEAADVVLLDPRVEEPVPQRVVEEDAVQRAMSTPPQTTRAKVRGDFIRFARAKNRSYTVDWTYLKLNGYWEETILCMDPFSAVNRRVDELVSQVSGLRFYR